MLTNVFLFLCFDKRCHSSREDEGKLGGSIPQTGLFLRKSFSNYLTDDNVNPFTPKSDLIDFTLSNTRRFSTSQGDPLGVKGLKKTISLNPFTPKSDLIDFTLSNARRFYSSQGDPLGVKGLMDVFLQCFFMNKYNC